MSYGRSAAGIEITSSVEVDEILRSPDFVTHAPDREEFLSGSILLVDGAEHHQRRKMEAALFTKSAMLHYERVSLVPTITEVLERELDGVPDHEVAVVDVVPLIRDMLHRISAGVTGLDGVDTPERVEAFRRQTELLHFGSTAEVALDPETALADARAAREDFVNDFFAPSLERRRDLHRRRVAGEEVESPVDLLSLLVSHDLDREDWVLSEAVLYVIAAITTTTHAVPHVIGHLTEWMGDDDARRARCDDPQFLRSAIAESLRLHTPNPLLLRRVETATTLESTGRHLAEGEIVVLRFSVANRDPAVFGADSDSFDPDREVAGRGLKGWGHSFGGGAHTCIGRPLVIGVPSRRDPAQETDGTMSHILRELFRRDVRPDPELGFERNTTSQHDMYPKYHVRLRGVR